jgi:G3E family GTPase
MTTIDIISGFLGAGKTTLIKKLIAESFQGQKLVLIENEFGEIGIDGGFLKDAGIEITEMNAGCICCSLVGDFNTALRQVYEQYHPDRILIEPSGVGKLSDVSKAVGRVAEDTEMALGSAVTVVNAKKCRMSMKLSSDAKPIPATSEGTSRRCLHRPAGRKRSPAKTPPFTVSTRFTAIWRKTCEKCIDCRGHAE